MPTLPATRALLESTLLLCVFASGEVLAEDEHPPEGYAPGIELPQGEGRLLLETACTRCHNLAGLEAYKGYWNRVRWQSMVETMVRNGAVLDDEQREVVTDYLTQHFGPGTREK